MDKIKLDDIAKLAGVSKATVSRVIHSPNMVKDRTLQRVRDVIRQNNYVYDAVAGDLSRKKTSVIGLIIPTIKSSIFASSTYGIQDEARKRGLTTILGNSDYDDQATLGLLKWLQERRVAGLILTGLSDVEKPLVKHLIKSGTPCVVTWEALDDKTISYVGFDNFKAAHTVTSYLINLQHKRIGLIVGPYSRVKRVRQRYDGYRGALQDRGLSFDPDLVIEADYTLMDGKEAMHRLLSLPTPLSAVFAASDVLAMGALAAIREKGLEVPKDISIAGFDNIDFASYCDPPLTTVKVPANEMGRLAVKVLFELLYKGPEYVRQYCLDTNLIIRDSCQVLSEV